MIPSGAIACIALVGVAAAVMALGWIFPTPIPFDTPDSFDGTPGPGRWHQPLDGCVGVDPGETSAHSDRT